MSSSSEAFGRTTVEALLAGCLVIGSQSGATPELLNYGNAGMLYRKGDTKHLAEVLKYALLNREVVCNIAKKGQQFAIENFTAEVNAMHVAHLYESTLQANE